MRALAVIIAIGVTGAAAAAPRPRGESSVTIMSSKDASPDELAAHVRERHGEIVRRTLLDVLHRSGADVRHAGIAPRQIDASVIAWRIASAAGRIDVSTVLRIVICDENGKMIAIVTGRAKLSVPSRGAQLAELREQALAEAVGGMTQSLHSQLDRATS